MDTVLIGASFCYDFTFSFSSSLQAMSYTSQSTLNQWRKVRLDRMLVDYFLRNGYYDSANKLADARGLRELTNVGKLYIHEPVPSMAIQQSWISIWRLLSLYTVPKTQNKILRTK